MADPGQTVTKTVTLFFAEIDASVMAGGRLFDVMAEGQLKLDNYDIYATADGTTAAANDGGNRAVKATFTIQVSDGVLDLSFVGVAGQALVSGIQIT